MNIRIPAKVDAIGRVTVPKTIREITGLKPNQTVIIAVTDEKIEIITNTKGE